MATTGPGEGHVRINLGPSHPATHGVMHNIIDLNGERVVKSEQIIGYVHRCFEKLAEQYTYNQFLTCTDRMNYVSAPLNNTAWLCAVEKALGIIIPERAQHLRVIINELSRVCDHFVFLGVMGVDVGALTSFTWLYREREKFMQMLEKFVGARLTTSFGRVGGLQYDAYDGFETEVKALIKSFRKSQKEFEGLLLKNKIFMDRTIGVGQISSERALSYGYTGPNLRACGVEYDIRKKSPYLGYENFRFDIPVGENGDAYDRFLIRCAEITESLRIVEQAINNLPKGPVMTSDDKVALPKKEDVYTDMGSLIDHFKIMTEGIRLPAGEYYSSYEIANGEMGFYIVSTGDKVPYRVAVRRPCFWFYQSFSELIQGKLLSDVVVTMSSLNVIVGELDG
ncbi:MAG: NADH-quinone oxidoreductase subunit D [Spirochaetes bacterium]|nr:NADH-quinone oxidoreductase subunit D [Spirochaetota bacterium]